MSVEGWVITKDHLEDGNGRFPGQTEEEADATQKSFEGVFGRTVHISRGELTLEQIQDPVRFQVRRLVKPANQEVVQIRRAAPTQRKTSLCHRLLLPSPIARTSTSSPSLLLV